MYSVAHVNVVDVVSDPAMKRSKIETFKLSNPSCP